MSENVYNIRQNLKLHHESHEKLVSGISSKRTNLNIGENPTRLTLPTAFCYSNDTTHLHRKCTEGYKFKKPQQKINHLMYMEDIKPFRENEKELETHIQMTRIYSQDNGIEFGNEKCAMLIMKGGKKGTTVGREALNQERFRTLGEKENYKYLAILKADTIKQ